MNNSTKQFEAKPRYRRELRAVTLRLFVAILADFVEKPAVETRLAASSELIPGRCRKKRGKPRLFLRAGYLRNRSVRACFMTWPPTSAIDVVMGISLGQISTQFWA